MTQSVPRFVGAVRVPTLPTLRRYGLDEATWRLMLARQGGSCGVCGNVPKSGILHIDHQHVRGWRKLMSQDRRKFTRGLLCFPCNSALRYRVTVNWLKSATEYLEDYLTRGQ